MTYSIPKTTKPIPIREYLRGKGYSQALIRQLTHEAGSITVDGQAARVTCLLTPGETLTVALPKEQGSSNIVPVPMKLNICYEDEHLMVLNKEAKIPIHPSLGNYSNTLANGIVHYFMERGEACTFRAINRLDRDTTGLLILAKNPLSACILSEMVKNRQIHRRYLAIVQGKLPLNGTVDAPIARTEGSIMEREVNFDRGEQAVTHYRRLFYDPSTDHSLAGLSLETGRTHQIRVHMKYIGHPLPGDFLYYPDYRFIQRQALHSFRLNFPHPITKEPLCFEAPLPDDMRFLGITSTEGLWDNDF